MNPPTAEGGALRSQDLRTSGDPAGLGGSILRLDPTTGAAAPGNPNAGSSDPNARRIVAQGLRNPFRITVRPGTNEVWAGDVGWSDWEEIDRVVNPTSGTTNFGWPCYEGVGRQPGYDGANLNICENLYAAGASAVTAPYYTYNHASSVVGGDGCPTGGSSISGVDFYTTGPFPDSYDGALFFADYTRSCIWVMKRGANGLPDPAQREIFIAGAAAPVDIQIGPNGDLFYADLNGGSIRRVRWPNDAPTARATATPTSGAPPLTVAVRRHRLERPQRRGADLRVGPRRRRPVRRLDGVAADVHVLGVRHLHGPAARDRHRRADGDGQPGRHRRRPADRDDRHAGGRHHVAGRPGHHVLRVGAQLPGRLAAGDLDAQPAPLLRAGPEQLPHARGPALHGRDRLLHGARPRVPVVPGSRGRGDRLRRPVVADDAAPGPADGRPDASSRRRPGSSSRSAARPRSRRSRAR